MMSTARALPPLRPVQLRDSVILEEVRHTSGSYPSAMRMTRGIPKLPSLLLAMALCVSIAANQSPGVMAGGGRTAASNGGQSGDEAASLVREALQSGDASRLKQLLPSDSKVYLSIRTIGPARGLHARGQVLVLLQQLFDRCGRNGLGSWNTDGGAGGVPVNAHATLKCNGGSGPDEVRLHLTVERSGDSWRLSEVWESD